MPTPIALAIPVQPGMLDAWRLFVAELRGPRAAEYRLFQARRGVTQEQMFHQPTPEGDIVILVLTCQDPARALGVLAQPREPFDRWFVERLQAIHGFTPEVLQQLRPGTLAASWPAAPVGAG